MILAGGIKQAARRTTRPVLTLSAGPVSQDSPIVWDVRAASAGTSRMTTALESGHPERVAAEAIRWTSRPIPVSDTQALPGLALRRPDAGAAPYPPVEASSRSSHRARIRSARSRSRRSRRTASSVSPVPPTARLTPASTSSARISNSRRRAACDQPSPARCAPCSSEIDPLDLAAVAQEDVSLGVAPPQYDQRLRQVGQERGVMVLQIHLRQPRRHRNPRIGTKPLDVSAQHGLHLALQRDAGPRQPRLRLHRR